MSSIINPVNVTIQVD